MKATTTLLATGLFAMALAAAGCAAEDAGPGGDKPTADPDQATLDVGKADQISNWYTTIAGDIGADAIVHASIDYPDWFHGYTIEMTAGQRVEVYVKASELGEVRFYGPAQGMIAGQPRFRQAVYRGRTRFDGDLWTSVFEVAADEAGTYMIVYGPTYYWRADYTVQTQCIDGCGYDDQCFGDDQCADGEFCGDNGVRCITTPCPNYDVCQAQKGVNEMCTRSGECADGLPCVNDKCTDLGGGGAGIGEACEAHDGCADGFCGCVDSSCTARICKAYAAEGESCGGFVMPHMYRTCGPDLACVAPQFIADIPGHCGVMVTVAELTRDPRAYDGRFVAVQGFIEPTVPMCTKMGCSIENPCCNGCAAEERLVDVRGDVQAHGPAVDLTEGGEVIGCTGNECTVYEQCDVEAGAWYVAGWFSAANEYALTIDVVRRMQGGDWLTE